MKTYGNGMKSTDISKKQIGVIYGNAKNGALTVEKWVMKNFYNVADYYGYDDNRAVEEAEGKIKKILIAVFDGNMEEAQKLIDAYTEKTFSMISQKNREKADREIVA